MGRQQVVKQQRLRRALLKRHALKKKNHWIVTLYSRCAGALTFQIFFSCQHVCPAHGLFPAPISANCSPAERKKKVEAFQVSIGLWKFFFLCGHIHLGHIHLGFISYCAMYS